MVNLKNGDCLELLKTIPSGSVDAVVTDPPYGILGKHKIETVIDFDLFFTECFRVLKNNAFIAFFGQMPSILNWHNAAIKAGFKFREDITWVKRKISSPYLPILRQKETIFIYSKGNIKFRKTKGEFEDVKMPLYADGLLNIESLKRYIADLRYEIKYRKKRIVTRVNKKTNDNIYNSIKAKPTHGSSEFVNFTNVWSFMPHNHTGYGKIEFNVKHPTVKPIPCLERLVELLTNEGDTVLDTFLGSGTTGIAAVNLNRDFIGFELDKDYFEIAQKRIAAAQIEKDKELF